jgi:hypothetical protein
VLHVDLHEVAEDEKVTVMVPVETSGEAAGVKERWRRAGTRAVQAESAQPAEGFAGAVIVVDVTPLEIGKSIHLGDIKAPEGVEILGDKHLTVVAVAAPRTEVRGSGRRPPPPPGAGDVEMIKEKKEDGTEGRHRRRAGQGPAKAAAKGDKAGERSPRPRPRRRNNLGGAGCRADPARHGFRASHRGAWGIPGRSTAGPGTMPGFCWWKHWRRCGGWVDGREKVSTPGWPGGARRPAGLACQPQTFMNLSGESVRCR